MAKRFRTIFLAACLFAFVWFPAVSASANGESLVNVPLMAVSSLGLTANAADAGTAYVAKAYLAIGHFVYSVAGSCLNDAALGIKDDFESVIGVSKLAYGIFSSEYAINAVPRVYLSIGSALYNFSEAYLNSAEDAVASMIGAFRLAGKVTRDTSFAVTDGVSALVMLALNIK